MSARRVVVGIVYRKDGKNIRFLVLHRTLGWKGWEFPKGGVERKDVVEENALKRELAEEANLTNIRIGEKVPYQIKYRYPKSYEDKYKHSSTVQDVYLVQSFQDDVKTDKEHDSFRWLPYEKARNLLTHENQKKALDIAWRILRSKKEDAKSRPITFAIF